MRDPLTQLATRQHFSSFLEEEWPCSAREGSSLAVLMIDVDHLGALNDGRGREAGDECLRRIAGVLGGRVRRASDLVARGDDDEFAVVLVGADDIGARSVAEWLRAEVERQQIPHGASPVSDYVTLSVGVAVTTPREDASPEPLVAEAVAALCLAKQLGRNVVVSSSSSDGIV